MFAIVYDFRDMKKYWGGFGLPPLHKWVDKKENAVRYESKKKAVQMVKDQRKENQWLSVGIHVEEL